MSFRDSVGDINVMHRKILRSNLMTKFEAKGYGGRVTQNLYILYTFQTIFST